MIAVARLAKLVGLLGLVPFVLAIVCLYGMTDDATWVLNYFYLYSAGILAFMAGVYWPLAMQLERERCYPMSPMVTMLLSQVFFLTAGLGLLLPIAAQIVVYTAAYVGLYVVDAKWMRLYWPSWYLKLRMTLTSVVLICQIAAGIGYFTFVH